MNYLSKIALSLIILFVLSNCNYEFPTAPAPTSNPGDYDIQNLAIIGSDMSAGLRDAALFNDGQNTSFSSLLANHITLENFNQFDINSTNGLNIFDFENTPSLSGKYELVFRNDSTPWVAQSALEGSAITPYEGTLSDINNFSVPNLKSYQLDDPTDLDENVYFERLPINPGESLLDIALQGSPSMIMLEMGISDIFEFALNGASGEDNPNPATITNKDLTPTTVFESSIDNAVTRMLNESSADILLFTIPDPLKLPYFTSLPWYFTVEEFSILAFNHLTFYSSFNIDVQNYNASTNDFTQYRPVIAFDVLGGRTFKSKVIVDEYLIDATTEGGSVIPKYRQMTDDDLFLYNAEKLHYQSMQTTTAFGTTTPIADQYVITESEIEVINERRSEFNQKIKDLAESSSRIYLVDLEKLIEDVNKGEVIYNGVTLTLDFDYKTIISADGINFNAIGQALIANEIIKVLNQNFNSGILNIDINKFPGNSYSTSTN